jgi:hypothetical protein
MPTLALAGDIVLGWGVNTGAPRRALEEFRGNALPVLRPGTQSSVTCSPQSPDTRPQGREPWPLPSVVDLLLGWR